MYTAFVKNKQTLKHVHCLLLKKNGLLKNGHLLGLGLKYLVKLLPAIIY